MAFSFGATAATTRPSLFGGTSGGLFGSSAPATGGIFGAPASTASGGLFGTATSGGLFGAASTPSTGFSFGQAAQPAQSTSGFGGFGTAQGINPASTGFSGFGFGASSTVTPSLAFGAAATTSVPSSTGFSFANPNAASPFGAATSSAGFGGLGGGPKFGISATGGTGLFGAAVSKPSTTGFSMGTMFTGATQPGGLFNNTAQPTAAQAVATQQSALANIGTAVSMPTLFGDERDAVIAKWNQLQAFWGMGRGYFTQQGQYVDFTPDNPFSLFKAVGFSCIPMTKDEDGLISLFIQKSMDEVCNNRDQIIKALHIMFRQQPNLTICIDNVRPVVEGKVELVFYIENREIGTTTRIPASSVYAHLNTNDIQRCLTTQLHVTSVMPRSALTPAQLKLYLACPPSGIDSRIWDQAKLDNPDPERLVPVPMVGFSELHLRLKHQDQQTQLHQSRLELISSDISTLRHKLADMVAKLDQYKRTQLQLSHRVLKVLVQQEIHRKHSYAVQANEEQLRVDLETIACDLNAPTQFKGRLNELMSQLRLQNQAVAIHSESGGYKIDANVQYEIQQHLKRQQEGLKHLVDIINDDLGDLKLIEQGLAESTKVRR